MVQAPPPIEAMASLDALVNEINQDETGPLWVADTGHHRLLGWRHQSDLSLLHGASAEALVGQFDFQDKGENRSYGLPQWDSLCWPYAVQHQGSTVAIADSGNNRILLWRGA